ncbi:MAG: WD40 repeat domain-containing protein [Gemmataceae bacterium]
MNPATQPTTKEQSASAPAVPAVDPTKARLWKEFKHNSPLISGRFEPAGRFVFAGAQDNTIQRWELETGAKTALTGHPSWVRAITVAPSHNLLISGDFHGNILFWTMDADTPMPLNTLEAHEGWVRALAVSPDGKTLASCGNDHKVKLWSLPQGKPLRVLEGHDCHVYNLAYHPSGQHLASIDHQGNVKHWDLTKGTEVRQLDAKVLHKYDPTFRADIGGARGMEFSPDGGLLACAGITDVTNAFAGIGKPLVVLFDWQSGKHKHLMRPKTDFRGTCWGVKFHPSGMLIAVGGGAGGALWFWKPDQAQSFFDFKLPNNARDLDLHVNGTLLAVPFFDSIVRVYDISPPPAKPEPAPAKPAPK